MIIGDKVKTYGGWEAVVIWIPRQDLEGGFYAIHKPNEIDESVPIYHRKDGSALSSLSVHSPPTYNKHHPADIIIG